MDDPIADPKLKQARQEIQAVLERYDIAGFVALHNAPNRGECWLRVTPSYSRMDGGPTVYRLKATLAQFDGDAEAQRSALAATANMLSLLATMTAETALPLLELSKHVDGVVGIEHTPVRRQPDLPRGAH